MKILFEDNHLLVLFKESGVLTQPTSAEDFSVESWGKQWLKEKYGKPGEVFLHAVHRLDKPASGVVVCARTSKALSRLQESMRTGDVEKYYVAVVEGKLDEKEGQLIDYLVHDEHKARVTSKGDPNGKKAVLQYKVLDERNGYSFLEIQLETGRYHQIRCQLAHRGHPLVGDDKYGSSKKFKLGIALCHFAFVIPHPITKEKMRFDVPVNSFFENLAF